MTTRVVDILPAAAAHGSRPASGPDGTLFSCTSHGLIYRYTNAGGWATWATLAGTALTTKGDLLTYDTGLVRLPVGTDGQVLTADSTVAKGVKWATPSGGGGGATTPYNIALDAVYTITAGTVWGTYPDTGPPTVRFVGGAWRSYTAVQKLTDGIKTGAYTNGCFLGFTAASADPEFTFDFGSAKTVSQVNVCGTGGAGGLGFPTGFVVDFSDNGTSWTNAFSDTGNTGPTSGGDNNWNAALPFTASAHRYWRVKVARSADIFLSEIEVLGY